MNAIRIRTQIESTTLHLPELGPLVGKVVEIVVWEEAERASRSARSVAFDPGAGLDFQLDDALTESGALCRLA